MAENKVQSRGTNGMAIASFILSLVGLGVFGIILGFIALSQIKKQPQEGRGFAIAGIVIGFLSVAALIIVIIMWMLLWRTAIGVIESPLYNGQVQNALNDLNNIQFNFQ